MTSLLQRFVYSMEILRRSACFKLNKLATKLGHHQQKERKSRNESVLAFQQVLTPLWVRSLLVYLNKHRSISFHVGFATFHPYHFILSIYMARYCLSWVLTKEKAILLQTDRKPSLKHSQVAALTNDVLLFLFNSLNVFDVCLFITGMSFDSGLYLFSFLSQEWMFK